MHTIKTTCFRGKNSARQLAIAATVSLALALSLSACENVAGSTQSSLVRFIDASYMAPAVNVTVAGKFTAANIGQGTITAYAALPAATGALIDIAAATGGTALVTANGNLLAGHQQSILLSDTVAPPVTYQVTLLQDQQVSAPTGQSDFRFLNQAQKTGPVDIYMVPSGVTLANAIPLLAALPVGASATYVSFPSQTVTMVITPTGVIKPSYTSAARNLTGGEVRTVLILDTQLTSNPPVEVFIADDVN
jgi:Domain of unknown function (DUF4397)